MSDLIEKTVLEFNDAGKLIFIGGVCKAKSFRRGDL